jgi:hypothetical protein
VRVGTPHLQTGRASYLAPPRALDGGALPRERFSPMTPNGSRSRRRLEPAVATADTEPMNNFNGCADSSFAPRLACFRWHDDGPSVWVMIVGDRSLPDAITWHSSIK